MLIAILTEYFETMKGEERALMGGHQGILGNTVERYAKLAHFTLADDLCPTRVEAHDLVQLVPRPDDLPRGEEVALWTLLMPGEGEPGGMRRHEALRE